MMRRDSSRTTHTRRGFCELAGLGLVAHVVGCGDDGSSTGSGDSSTGAGDDDDGSDATTQSSASQSASSSSSDVGSSEGGSSQGDGESTTTTDASTTTDAADSSGSSDTGEALCEPSPPSIEGPFYRPGMPVRSELDIYGDDGVPLVMSGRVLDTSCQPVANAVVELWHATPIAPATEPEEFVATYDDTDEYRYYGQVATDAEGRYAFETLRPGWYLNGPQYRPAHLHVKIWTGNEERLTTQLYFEDDPFAAMDPWFDATMVLVTNDSGEAEFDFTI